MAINFPSSPNVNDTHTHNGKEWTWNGTSWVQSTNASSYTLPIATAGALGGIRVGNRLTIDSSTGVLDADVQGGSYGDGDVDTHLNQSNPTSGHVLSWNGSDYAWVAQTTDTNTQLTTEQVQDIVGAMVDGGTETRIGVTYDDTAGKLNFVADDQSSTPYTNSDVDTHLNQSNPTSGYVLAWNGSDYTWVAQTGGGSGGSGGSILQLIQETGPSNQISATAGQGSNAAWIDVIDKDITITAGANKRVKIEVNGEPKLNGFRTMRYEIRLIRTTSSVETTLYEGYQGLADSSDNYSTMNGVLYLDTPGAGTHNYKYQFRQVISWNNSAAYVEPDSMVMLLTEMDLSANVLSASDVDNHLNQSNPTSGYVLSWNGSDYAWVAQTTDTDTVYTDSDVDTHLNTSGALSGEILQWNGSDYAWVAQSNTTSFTALTDTPNSYSADQWVKVNAAGNAIEFTTAPAESDTLDTVTGRGATTTNDVTVGNFICDNLTVNGTQTIIDSNTVNIGDNILTLNSDEAGTPSQNAGLEIERGTSTNVSIRWNETTDKWQYTNDGSNYSDIGSSTYTNTDVDTHLNQSNPTSGYVLSWNGSDYAWVAQTTDTDTNTFTGLTGTPSSYTANKWLKVNAGGTALEYTDAPSGASVTVSDNAPSGPSAGDLWWDSDNGRLKVYYTDATPDSQWVDASPLGANSSIGTGNTSIAITDTGTNGTIQFNTDGTDRWKITSGGHILPNTNASFDIGSAEYKVRHLFLSDNSLKFVDDNNVEHALSVNSNKLHYEGKEVLANCVFTGLANNDSITYNGTNWVNSPAASPSSIGADDTSISVTDTNGNGTITITTEGTDRWTWNDNGHLKPAVTGAVGSVAGFDIGNASYKVREFHCSSVTITPDDGITTTKLTASGDLTVDTDVLKVDTAQNQVGIGTASPSSLLHLKQAQDAVYITFDSNSNVPFWLGTYGTNAGFFLEQGSTNNNLLTTDANDYVSLYGAGTKRFETDGSGVLITGKLGIGGTASAKLDLIDANNSQDLRVYSQGLSNTSKLQLRTGNSGNCIIEMGDTADADIGGIRYTNWGDENWMGFTTNASERFRITSTGALTFNATSTGHGTSGQVLTSNGDGSPSWQTVSSSAPAFQSNWRIPL